MSNAPNEPFSLFHDTLKGAAIGAGIGLAIEAGRALNTALDRLDRITTATEKMARRGQVGSASVNTIIAESIPIINHGFASIRKRAISRGLFMWFYERRNDFDADEPGRLMDERVALLSEIVGWLTSLRRWNGALMEIESTLTMLDGQLNPLAAHERARRPEAPWRMSGWDGLFGEWVGSVCRLCMQAKQWNSHAVWNLFENLQADNMILLNQLAPNLFHVPRPLFCHHRFSDGAMIAARSAADTCRTAVIASGQEKAEGGLVISRIPLLAAGLPRFCVKGVRKQAAAEVDIILKASIQEVVGLIADALGIAIASVSPVEQPEIPDRPLNESELELINRKAEEFGDLERREDGSFASEMKIDGFGPNFMI
jgi:hypothetical protein